MTSNYTQMSKLIYDDMHQPTIYADRLYFSFSFDFTDANANAFFFYTLKTDEFVVVSTFPCQLNASPVSEALLAMI